MENWDIIVITCSCSRLTPCLEEEVEILQKKGCIHRSVPVLVVEDPANDMGSGAATVNGLLIATEYLSVQKSYSVVNADVLTEAHVLILHQGRNCIYTNCGTSLINVPKIWTDGCFEIEDGNNDVSDDSMITNLELLFDVIERVSVGCPPGVWVCSTDMSLVMKGGFTFDWKSAADVVLFSAPSDLDYACQHGVVHTNKDGHVANIIFHGSSSTISEYSCGDGSLLIVSGLVFMSSAVAESLLSLHSVSPLESCTYIGVDSGAQPVQVSLYFDILMSMATDINEDEFLDGKYGETYNMSAGFGEERTKNMKMGRKLVWRELSKFKMTAGVLRNCTHVYWSDHFPAAGFVCNLLSRKMGTRHSWMQVNSNAQHLFNSLLRVSGSCHIGRNVVIMDCDISAEDVVIGDDCYLSGINTDDLSAKFVDLPNGIVVLSFPSPHPPDGSILVIFGIEDNLFLPSAIGTFANKPWFHLYDRLGITGVDLWEHDMDLSKMTLMNARLYSSNNFGGNFLLTCESVPNLEDAVRKWRDSPRYSLEELLNNVNYKNKISQRRRLYSLITAEEVKKVLLQNEDVSVLSYFVASVAEGWSDVLLEALDSILLSESNYAILTRTLSTMADLLGLMAGKAGGLRSGPGSNKLWHTAFNYLENGNIQTGMMHLQQERKKWLSNPNQVMRAARHYERAAQIMIQNCVKMLKQCAPSSEVSFPEIGTWVNAECPARIDLQGGWTDTPPICYELGGSVVNVAVLIDGKKPISAKARRKEPLNIELVFGVKDSPTRLVIEEKSGILDFGQPYAQGALLKAVICYAGIVDLNSDLTLKEQLSRCCGSGLEVHAYSDLPHGCGMGTSSILAGAILAALWSVTGKHFQKMDIVRAVLCVEQLLTTGGGWQDQFGGIMGGLKRAFSNRGLPLELDLNRIILTEEVTQKLNEHLVLIYTGKVRLAKNILQNVIRNWYARDMTVMTCFRDLITASIAMEEALLKGDLEQIGRLMDQYWTQKKILAPGCEPSSTKYIMDLLRPVSFGQILVGAGGGGFMCILTRKPNAHETIKQLISNTQLSSDVTCHAVSIDFTGLVVSSEC